MRITGGTLSGRRLNAPKGRVSRPTADRTREALFNILSARADFSFDGARIIDLFAGSGALGFEALSRGGAWCLFVETDAAARAAIRDNIEALSLFGQTRIHRRSATSLGKKPAGVGDRFNLAFLDPPYEKDLAPAALNELAAGGWLVDGALIIVEQSAKETPVQAAQFEEIDRRQYGAAQIGLLAYSAS